MNKEELEKVEQLIEQKDSEQLKDLLAGLHPADIAELCNELDAEEARFSLMMIVREYFHETEFHDGIGHNT